jgi:hypothetical protein
VGIEQIGEMATPLSSEEAQANAGTDPLIGEWMARNREEVEARKDTPIDLGRLPDDDKGASRIHGYKNYKGVPFGPWTLSNCGQAAVATIWDYWGFDPGYAGPRVVTDGQYPGQGFWHDIRVVDEITSRFPNDIGGASPNRLCDAFSAAGFRNGWGWGPQTTYETIAPFINNSVPVPVICLLKWGAGIDSLHWVCVYALSNGYVWFTNPAEPWTAADPNDPAELSREKWRLGGLTYEDFGNRWSWTGITKCHVVAFRG